MVNLLTSEFEKSLGKNSVQFDNLHENHELGQGKRFFTIEKASESLDGEFWKVEGSLYFSLGGDSSSFVYPKFANPKMSLIRFRSESRVDKGFGVISYYAFILKKNVSNFNGNIDSIRINDEFTVEKNTNKDFFKSFLSKFKKKENKK